MIRVVATRWGSGLALLLAATAACTASASTPTSTTSTVAPSPAPTGTTDTMALGDRPFNLQVPASYRSGVAAPLVILLHGYTSSGSRQEGYMKFTPESDKRGFLYATPDGTADAMGNRFWNATTACCDFYGSQVDDEKYLVDIIKTVSAKYTVDPKRVYLIGHSNGAFMSYRMACDHADLIAGIAALNGAMMDDATACRPSRPVSVLNIRSTADDTIVNNGGVIAGHAYPSTDVTVGDWVKLDGCASATPDTSAPLIDLESQVSGLDTSINRYPGCRNSTVELWRIRDAGHIPRFTENFVPDVMNFLYAQSL